MHNYFNIYMLLLTLSVLLLSLDGFDLVTTFTSVATRLNNVGPGLEMVGPMGSFADFSAPAILWLAPPWSGAPRPPARAPPLSAARSPAPRRNRDRRGEGGEADVAV